MKDRKAITAYGLFLMGIGNRVFPATALAADDLVSRNVDMVRAVRALAFFAEGVKRHADLLSA